MRQAVSSLQAFDLLSPQGMRASSRIDQNVGLGADGGQIAAFIAAMSDKVPGLPNNVALKPSELHLFLGFLQKFVAFSSFFIYH